MPWEAIDASGISAQDRAEIEAVEDQSWPTVPEVIWNGRVAPIVGYAAKGIIWYQGCSNIGQRCYDKLQAAMVRYWREQWGRDLPFIFALLAPYSHGDSRGTWRPEFVATQLNTENLLSNAWAVSTETLGDEITIHPPKKQEVADMMLQRALQNVYGIPVGIDIELPRPVQTEFQEDGSVKLRLSHVWSNLMSMRARSIRGFELLTMPFKKMPEGEGKNSRRRVLRTREERLAWLRLLTQTRFCILKAKELSWCLQRYMCSCFTWNTAL